MEARQKWDLSMLNNKIREDFFLLKFQKFWKSAHHTNSKILFYESHTKFDHINTAKVSLWFFGQNSHKSQHNFTAFSTFILRGVWYVICRTIFWYLYVV